MMNVYEHSSFFFGRIVAFAGSDIEIRTRDFYFNRPPFTVLFRANRLITERILRAEFINDIFECCAH